MWLIENTISNKEEKEKVFKAYIPINDQTSLQVYAHTYNIVNYNVSITQIMEMIHF